MSLDGAIAPQRATRVATLAGATPTIEQINMAFDRTNPKENT